VPLSAIRVVTTAVCLACFFGARRIVAALSPFVAGILLLALASGSVTALCLVLDGYKSPYYAGVLLAICASVLFPWGARWEAAAVSALVVIYLLAVLVGARFVIDRPDLLINNLCFLVGTSVASIASAHKADALRRESFAHMLRVKHLKTQFFANVSHELRTPLTLILVPVDALLGHKDLDETTARDLRIVRRNARTLLGHVNDLLEVARLEAGKVELHYATVDVAELVRLVASQFELEAQRRSIEFRVEAATRALAAVDREKAERIVLNLLSNALKFTPDGGRIRIAVAESGDRVSISVGDSGPGIPETFRDRVFERFFQVEPSATRRHGGTGLGLAIVRDFVDLHGGVVSIGTAPEGGALVHLELPRHAPAGVEVEAEGPREPVARSALVGPMEETLTDAHAAVASSGEGGDRRPLVLVVEDHPEMRAYVAAMLAREWRVAVARDGSDGFEQAVALHPAVIVSDLMMPGLSGADLLEKLRANEATRSIPFMLLTAKADDALRAQLLRAGAQDYVMKPFVAEELRARVGNLISVHRTREVLEGELKGSRESLETLAERLVDARDAAQDALRMRGEFMSMASHELRTPLTAMKLQNAHARRTLSAPDGLNLVAVTAALTRADQLIMRLQAIVDRMLDLSHISSRILQLNLAEMDLCELARGVVARTCDPTEPWVTLSCPSHPITGQWDARRLEQVLVLLLTNAQRYGEGKPVTVDIQRTGFGVVLSVTDHGIGIGAEDQARIFDHFERAAPQDGVPGLGIGLTIARSIVELHGGTIRVESALGRGATFTVELPCALDDRMLVI
jgi:signal transduction histidine kinase